MTNSKKRFFELSSITLPEVLGWLFIVSLFWSLGAYNMMVDYERRQIAVSLFRLVTNEASSGFSALLLVLFVRAMLDRFPFSREQLLTPFVAHAGGTILFSLAHIGMMATLRELVFAIAGQDYVHAASEGLMGVIVYEYAKDLPIYVAFSVVILLYRYFKKPVSATSPENQPATINKILVKHGKADKALDLASVDWFQAASNYVRVFASGEEYLTRDTLSAIEKKLAAGPFLRVHRSFVVNLEQIEEIAPLESGGHRLALKGGAHIPVGRRYRDALYARIKG